MFKKNAADIIDKQAGSSLRGNDKRHADLRMACHVITWSVCPYVCPSVLPLATSYPLNILKSFWVTVTVLSWNIVHTL